MNKFLFGYLKLANFLFNIQTNEILQFLITAVVKVF